jgi:hypothetical protein
LVLSRTVVLCLLDLLRGEIMIRSQNLLLSNLVFAVTLFAQSDRVPAGTEVTVRTNESIDANSPSDFRVYTGTVERDVTNRDGRVLIPRGSQAELILRDADSNNVVLDLESITVNGERLSVASTPERVPAEGGKESVGANKRTGRYVGGGAVIGAIIGAIAGGGKGAAIGAATGGGAGAVGQTVTRGRNVRLPVESLVTFRLDRGLNVADADRGTMKEGHHYHGYYREDRNRDDR